jgi:putative endonuclease
MTNAEVGKMGENLADKWLSRHGRKVLYRNFSGPKGGEVDIVCRHEKVLAFVEVKTRTSEKFGRPADAVNQEKQLLIQRGAAEWMRMLNRPVLAFRFDIVEVILTEGERPVVRVIENAFQLPQGNMQGRVATG